MHPVQSPLFMAMNDPVLHGFISYLAQTKTETERAVDSKVRIELPRKLIEAVRVAFRQNILEGERNLHSLAHVLATTLFHGGFELHSNVIGILPGKDDRPFLIRERIARDTLFNSLDIDLGNQIVDNFRYNVDGQWVPLCLSANFVEYIPVTDPGTGTNRLTSRVKAEEEIWNKVTDEIFHVDDLLTRDKHLQRFSKYVKDIFGIKIICEPEQTCLKLHDELQHLTLHDGTQLKFIETKNYLTCAPSEMKKTGWKALKSVVRWHDRLFEIQVQPLANYYLELDHMAGPSHQSFKLHRDHLREELTNSIPLYGFYRELLQMLFKDVDVLSFETDHASVVIT